MAQHQSKKVSYIISAVFSGLYHHFFFFLLLPEVCAQIKAGSKRLVTDNWGANACGRQSYGLCLTMLDGHFQPVPKVKRVNKVCHYPEVQLAPW